MCWPCRPNRAHNPKIHPPLFIKGPFKQVAVGLTESAVCVIRRQPTLAEEFPDKNYDSNRDMITLDVDGRVVRDMSRFGAHTAKGLIDIQALKAEGRHPSMHCWGVHDMSEEVMWWPIGWDQVHIPTDGPTCAVSMDSELFCFGHHPRAVQPMPDVIVA